MIWLAPFLFFGISFVFSMLGMGGAQLFIPILFWMGLDFKTEAIPLGIVLSLISSLSASSIYIRKQMVDWRIAIPFGLAMVAGAPLGTWVNVVISTRSVIIFFSVLTILGALVMLSGWAPKKKLMSPVGKLFLGIFGGVGLGFDAGLIGRGGGAMVVPLLTLFGVGAKTAAATSMFVVICSTTASLVSHLVAGAHPIWGLWATCALAVALGSNLGARFMSNKMKPRGVRVAFGIVLMIVAIALLVKDVGW
ncbi:MAG: sulfite exporter TauE/SafE family protein [Deltaproteobacteria bacterium]|nr:sulfite exporter TauE/SafE family protein [Deltaproteobacteria bacterium]